VVTHLGRLGLSRDLLVAATRMVIQLAIIGFVLEALFSVAALHWVALMALVMLLLAGREVMARQKRRMTGGWAFAIGTVSMFVSSFAVTVFALWWSSGRRPGTRRSTPSRCSACCSATP
jgi:putative ABC transport system permease protein